jgi:hypothetical protein
MRNKNRVFRIAALLLVLSLISTVMISGTFAKYTSTYAGQDTALVAKWSFEGFISQDPEGETAELPLFGHLYDQHINQKAGDDYIIAPGVSGEFVVEMEYLADVDADVTIEIEEGDDNPTNPEVPMEYSVDSGANWVTLDGLAEALVAAITTNDEYEGAVLDEFAGEQDAVGFRLLKSDVDETDPVEISETVQWQWVYDVSGEQDKADTAFGKDSAGENGRTSYGIKITVTAVQVEPEIEED